MEDNINNSEKSNLYKTKDYVRRANRNYYHNKLKFDNEYKTKAYENHKKFIENNRTIVNEKMRNYMRQYRERKKNEKLNSIPITNITNTTTPTTVNSSNTTNKINSNLCKIDKKTDTTPDIEIDVLTGNMQNLKC